jgi:hypothetical protein
MSEAEYVESIAPKAFQTASFAVLKHFLKRKEFRPVPEPED